MQETPSGSSANLQWNNVDQKQVNVGKFYQSIAYIKIHFYFQIELISNLCQSLLEQQQNVMSNQISPNFQWYSNYLQTQQSLMLSAISQCCQLMWLQQQDINSLMNTVAVVS